MRYMSVCSGIEAATVAWHSLGWKPAAFAEIDKFPRAVLQHHYPEVPIHGDFTTIGANDYGTVNLLVGGTPCQSFSIAGLRGGLDDDRGNLALEFMRLAARIEPTWIVWENVPGVLSSNGGRDFGSILGALGELGYGWAYRVLDAQHFGVPQRRRRVFVVGCLGGWQRAAAVLFERYSVSGNPPPRREKGKGVAVSVADCAGGSDDGGMIARCDTTGEGKRFDSETTTLVAQDVRCAHYSHDYANDRITDPAGVNPALSASATASGNLNVLEPIPFDPRQIHHPANFSNPKPGDVCHPLRAVANCEPAVAFDWQTGGDMRGLDPKPTAQLQRCQVPAVAFSAKDHGADAGDLAPTLRAMGHGNSHANGGGQVAAVCGAAVRRLTPRECERLQGFPDDYTAIPWRGKPADQCPDGSRYKALGNSMAVPVMAWIGSRIHAVDRLSRFR